MYIYTYMFIYNIQHLHAVVTNRIEVPRALCPAAQVVYKLRLLTLAGELITTHQSTIAVCE